MVWRAAKIELHQQPPRDMLPLDDDDDNDGGVHDGDDDAGEHHPELSYASTGWEARPSYRPPAILPTNSTYASSLYYQLSQYYHLSHYITYLNITN